MDSEFRELSRRGKDLVEKLLNAATDGRDELRTQLDHIKAKLIQDDGTLRLECAGGVPGKYTPVAEGICKDADGSDVSVILHLGKEGFMSMLEILKYQESAIINPPSAESLTINRVPMVEVLGPGRWRLMS